MSRYQPRIPTALALGVCQTSSCAVVVLLVLWWILIIAAVIGFVIIDNKWLEDRREK